MRAAIFRQHGGPEVIECGTMPEPTPGPGEVLVQLKAAALNHLDKFVRVGWPGLKLALPHITGSDGAGVVAAAGAGVSGWAAGDRVALNANVGCGACPACLAGHDNWCDHWHLLGETLPGLAAEWAVVPARQLFRLPAAVSFEKAAAAGLVYQTAWHSLITRGGLRAGETVLVVGAAGGVNTASIQIAKLAGATVYAVGSEARKLAVARDAGADVLIDRSQVEWGKEVFRLTGRRGVDVVVDNVGAATMPLSVRAVRKGGRVLTVGNTSGPKIDLDNRYLFSRHVTVIGSTMGTLADYATVMGLVCAGRLAPQIDTILPLAEVRAAHERLERGEVFGKLVLSV